MGYRGARSTPYCEPVAESGTVCHSPGPRVDSNQLCTRCQVLKHLLKAPLGSCSFHQRHLERKKTIFLASGLLDSAQPRAGTVSQAFAFLVHDLHHPSADHVDVFLLKVEGCVAERQPAQRSTQSCSSALARTELYRRALRRCRATIRCHMHTARQSLTRHRTCSRRPRSHKRWSAWAHARRCPSDTTQSSLPGGEPHCAATRRMPHDSRRVTNIALALAYWCALVGHMPSMVPFGGSPRAQANSISSKRGQWAARARCGQSMQAIKVRATTPGGGRQGNLILVLIFEPAHQVLMHGLMAAIPHRVVHLGALLLEVDARHVPVRIGGLPTIHTRRGSNTREAQRGV